MKIKIKYNNKSCQFSAIKKGEYIDLKASKNIELPSPYFDTTIGKIVFPKALVPLGFCMELPKYFEANLVSRSSTLNRYGCIAANGIGIIDSTYSGDEDEWKYSALAIDKVDIREGDRICQFRIQPSQFAPWWVKVKWLFTNKIEFIEVNYLKNVNRGGFGSTNK